jgi:two-component system, OmpR family, phosphate regulon response regulator PhoB
MSPQETNPIRRVVVIDSMLRTRMLTCRAVRRLGHMPIAFESIDALREHGPFSEEIDLALISIRSQITVEIASLDHVRGLLGRRAALGVQVPARDVFWVTRMMQPDAHDEIGAHLSRLFELFAWIERLMVRKGFSLPPKEAEWGPFHFSLATGAVHVSGQCIKLKPLEFDLAIGFFRNKERLLSREWLYAMFWGRRRDLTSRSLDVHVSRVRHALDLQLGGDWMLHGVSGHGYVLRGPLCSPMHIDRSCVQSSNAVHAS